MAENEDIEQVEEDAGKKSLFANKKLLIIIAAVLLLLIVGIGAFLFLGSSDDAEADTAEVTETTDTEQETGELDDLPPEEMTDESATLELPTVPVEEEPEQPASAADRLAAISGGLTNPEPLFGGDDDENSSQQAASSEQPPVDLPEGIDMPEYNDPNPPEDIVKTPIMHILEEFNTPEEMAEEIAKLRRRVELNTKETTRLYTELGGMEDKLREKDRIIRAQDTAYLKGPKVSPKRNSGPVAPPEPTWDVSPQHTGP